MTVIMEDLGGGGVIGPAERMAHRGRDRMVVGFTTICAITYHH